MRNINCTYGDDKFANENLKEEYKYHVGSWQGCGCGFQFDFSGESYFTQEDNKLGKQSVESLFEYLRNNIKGDNCEILSFWGR